MVREPTSLVLLLAMHDNCSLIMNVDNRTIRGLFDRFDQFFAPLISRMNDELQLGQLG